jgi:ABC-type multidrug transport system fused ATPase/permease subunit
MSRLPRLLERDRTADVLAVPLLGVVQAAALGIGAFATRDAFSALHSGQAPGLPILARLVAAGLIAAGAEFLARQRSEALGQSMARSIRHVLYSHLAGMDRREIASRRLGALSLRFVGDLTAARNWFGQGLPRLASTAVVLPGAALVLWLLNPVLAAVAAIPLLLSLAVLLALAFGLEARHRALRSRRAGISIAMMERIAISPDLDLLARTGRELATLDEDGAALRRNAVARARRVGLLRLIPQAGAALAGAAMLRVAGSGAASPGETAAGLAVLGILMIPLRELADIWDRLCAWRVARQKALSLLARPSHRREVRPQSRPIEVRLAGLMLGRRQIEAVIPAGFMVRICGPRGSGKSRLGHLLAGLDRAGTDTILYDGQASPLPRIVHVGDRPIVIQGSLRRALTLGISPRPQRREIEQAARAFGLKRLMSRIDGLGGRIGEAARTASDGEALRMDLTRAALSRPDLAVIDSARLLADPERDALLRTFRQMTDCTLFITGHPGDNIAWDMTIDLGDFPLLPRENANLFPV